MDINFSIDFDSGEIYGILDDSLTFTATKDDDNVLFKNIERIGDDELQDTIKKVCTLLLSIEG